MIPWLRSVLGRHCNRENIELASTVVIAVATVVYAVVAYRQWDAMRQQLNAMHESGESNARNMSQHMNIMRDQAKAMQGQLDQMQAETRAWLSVEDFSVERIQVSPAGAGIDVTARYNVANIGQSSASDVTITTTLALQRIDRFDEASVRALCRPPSSNGQTATADNNPVVLPGHRETISGTNAASFTRSVAEFGGATHSISTVLVLAGCVYYKIQGSEKPHATGFSYAVGIDTENLPHGAHGSSNAIAGIPIDVDKDGVVATESLKVLHDRIGNFAD